MIRLNVFVQVNKANHAEALNAAKELTAASQKEKGCIAYDTFESVTRKDVFMICETWDCPENLEAHQQTELFAKCISNIQKVATMKIEKFDF